MNSVDQPAPLAVSVKSNERRPRGSTFSTIGDHVRRAFPRGTHSRRRPVKQASWPNRIHSCVPHHQSAFDDGHCPAAAISRVS